MTRFRMTATVALAALLAGAPALAADLRTNIVADPAMVDPITYSELIAGDVMGNIYEAFTGLDASGNVVPRLATSWEPLKGNLGFRFNLRQGVKFHSGRAFGAKDVKYTLEQLLLPGNKAGLNAGYLGIIVGADKMKDGSATELSGVTIVDDHTIEIAFTQPDVLFPIYPIFIMDSGIVAEHGADWATRASAGTGPFRFVEWRIGQEVRLEAFADYWDGAPAIDAVRFLVVPDDNTAMSMYEAGELDVLYAGEKLNRRILGDAALAAETRKAAAAQIRFLGMNQNLYEPFKDIRVREAVCLSIDKQAMIDGLYAGAALPLAGQMTEGVAGYNPAVKGYPYDPERARALMAEAGFTGGQGLPPVKLSTTDPNKNEHLYYASQFQEVLGMPVEVEIVERATHIRGMNAGEVPFFAWGWSAGYPDALYFLSQVWYGPSPYNRSRWQNDAFDALIDKAFLTVDNAERYKLYAEAEQVLLDDFGTCPLTVRMQLALVKPNVQGVTLSAFRLLPFGDVTIE
jgi:peptide/nickel transport system substrate-binding protein